MFKEIGSQSFEQLIERNQSRQSLTIFNGTKLASDYYFQLAQHKQNCYHISGRMCPAHRVEVLRKAKEKGDLEFHLVATSVVEAGVDIDFPVLFRQFCPLDSLTQSAGRCNREGLLPAEQAIVYVFWIADYKAKANLALQIKASEKVMEQFSDPLDTEYFPSLKKYYNNLYNEYRDKGGKISGFKKDSKFTEINRSFWMIDDYNDSCVVAYGKGKELIQKLSKEPVLTGAMRKELQAYTASVFVAKNKQKDLLKFHQNGMVEWIGEYSELVGCVH